VLCAFLISCASAAKKISVVKATDEEQIIRDQVEETPVPTPSAVVSADAEESKLSEYIIQKGDSLWKISRSYYGKGALYPSIADTNAVNNPDLIFEGKKLLIPAPKYAVKPVPTRAVPANVKSKSGFEYRVSSNTRAFGVGEKLVYAVKYFNVTAGIGVLEIENMVEINGRKVYKLGALAQTAPFFESFFRVRDRIESYIDIVGLFSWKYSKKLEEGSYRANTAIEFNHEKAIATKHTGETYKIVPFTQDVLSELYYYRTFDLSPGNNEEVYIDVCADDGKSYQIVVKKLRYETVTVDAGTFDCVVVQPFLKFEGIFKQAGDVIIWMTNDANKVPVKVESKIPIGAIYAELQNATVVQAR
jgi:hypothetical protein